MLSSISKDISASKCYVSQGVLPNVFDPNQPPTKKRPFATILNQPFTHTVELILPGELYDLIWEELQRRIRDVRYARVVMPLSALLEGEFFNSYIKKGNILMLSEGRPGIDELYSLNEGVLRLEVSKALYERSGLGGRPVRDGGRKHLKKRYAIEINLRLPSMLHGKKGFERIVWAFKNVLNKPMTWLFHDFDDKLGTFDNGVSNNAPSEYPILQHHPAVRSLSPKAVKTNGVAVPTLNPSHVLSMALEFEDWAISLHEWISLITLESPRILNNDQADPFLWRRSFLETKSITSIVKVEWCGLIPGRWIRSIFIELCTLVAKDHGSNGNSWFALTAHPFHGQVFDGQSGYTIMWIPGGLRCMPDDQLVTECGGDGKGQSTKHGIFETPKENLRYLTIAVISPRISGRVSDEHRNILATDKMTQRLFGGISHTHKEIGPAALSLPLLSRSSSGKSRVRRNMGSSVVTLLSIDDSSPVS